MIPVLPFCTSLKTCFLSQIGWDIACIAIILVILLCMMGIIDAAVKIPAYKTNISSVRPFISISWRTLARAFTLLKALS